MVQRLYAGDGMRKGVGCHSLCRSNLNSPKTWGAQRPCAHQKCSQNKNDICRFTVLQTKINRHLCSILGQIINFIHCHILTSSLIYLHGDKFVKNNNNNGQLHFGRGKAGPGFLVYSKTVFHWTATQWYTNWYSWLMLTTKKNIKLLADGPSFVSCTTCLFN